MLRHPDYTRTRLAQLGDRMRERIYPERRPVDELRVSPRVDRVPYADAQRLEYTPARLGDSFGPLFATFWFQASATVPREWSGSRVDLLWLSHSEATLWIDGRARQGLNHTPLGKQEGSTRPDAVLLRRAQGGEHLSFQIEMACNQLFGKPEESRVSIKAISPFVLERCELARFDPLAWKLFSDFTVLQQLEADQGKGDLDPAWAGELLGELNRFANLYDPDERGTWEEAHPILQRLLSRKNGSTTHELSAIGHAHIDTAWLWPIAETYRKCVRTFSSQLGYMDEYPEYKFACSQAAQYAWVQERNPELWSRLVAKVRAGQFVPVGGTWVEPDCNLTSGESLVRQFLVGQRFFRKEFGITCREFWNPDVFGYNGQLPQLMRQAGIRFFLTQKLSWNRFNKPLHHTFLWQGLDGSEVLAHFPPADTYNAEVNISELRFAARNYRDHDRSRHSYLLFGFGDGGGGPTRRMLENLRRASDLEGLPRCAIRTPTEFFARLDEDCTDKPTVVGELYFEYHRGTYTSQALVKRENRKAEFLLHDLEFLAAAANGLGRVDYPRDTFERLWRTVLTHQFHDILPGSSIGQVYDDAKEAYLALRAEGEPLREELATALVQALAGEEGDGAVPLNTLGSERREVAAEPGGRLVFVQAPPFGTGAVVDAPEHVTASRLLDGSFALENAALRAVLAADGTLRSLVEKQSGREAVDGTANVLELYEDRPTDFDAWDVDPFHLETRQRCPAAHAAALTEEGPLRAAVTFDRRIGHASTMRQTVRLAAGARRLEFECEVEWQESHRLLKVAFPVQVRAMNATYEMQFGCVERPTHFNTSFDLARYEVPGHRWSDLSEHGFGVALLSESKYGYSTFGNTLRLSLLRAPESPDPKADRGSHRFSYALLPHVGGWREAGVVAEGLRFNVPLAWGRGRAPARSLFAVDDANLVLDTVKRAEDGPALLVRLYEAHGARGTARLRCALPFQKARRCNLLEEPGETLPVAGDEVTVAYRPFELISLILE